MNRPASENGPSPAPLVLSHGRFIAMVRHGVEFPGFFIADMIGEGPSVSVPAHTHESALVSFILCGTYRSSARGLDGVAGPGTLIYDPPGTTHEDRFTGPGGRFLTISLSATDCDGAHGADRLPECSFGIAEREVGFLGTRLARETSGADGFSALAQEALTLELLDHLRDPRPLRESNEPSWLAAACDFLWDGSGGPVTIRQVAASVGVHPVHLARVFRRHRGCTPGQYLRRVRVERATGLIRAGRPLAEVAHSCGFGDQSMLTKSFRRVLGQTPGAYRALTRRWNA